MVKKKNLFQKATLYFLLTGSCILLVLIFLLALGIGTIKKENEKALENTLNFIDNKLNDSFTEVYFQLDRISKDQYVNKLFFYDELTPSEKNTLHYQLKFVLSGAFSLASYALVTSAGLGMKDDSFFLAINDSIPAHIIEIFPTDEHGLIFSTTYNAFFAFKRLTDQNGEKEFVVFIELKEYNVCSFLNSLLPNSDEQNLSLVHRQKVVNEREQRAGMLTYEGKVSAFGLSYIYRTPRSSVLLSLQIFIIMGIGAILLCFLIAVVYLHVFNKKVSRPYQKLLYDQKVLALEANIKYLEAQISPHFLYNCLYSINLLAKCGKTAEVYEFSSKLGTFYKYAAKNFSDNVTLADEYECVKNYCEIQTLRFGRRIKVNLAPLPENMKGLFVPKFSIQALAENAYSHGMKSVEENGVIRIGFFENPQYFEISVEDNGKDLTDEKLHALQDRVAAHSVPEKETGILNLSMRLKLKYNDRARLILSRSALGGLHAKIHISHSDTSANGE